MKNLKFSRVSVIAVMLAVFLLVLDACPPLEEDENKEEDILTYDGDLDSEKWFEILDDVAMQDRLITLDLKDCKFVEGNTGGGLIRDYIYEHDSYGAPILGGDKLEFITFDPFPAVRWGKDKIATIILPDQARMIKQATANRVGKDDRVGTDDDSNKRKSAFAHFTNLSTVTGSNITIIGNYAFIDNEALEELNFPNLGRVGQDVSASELQDATNSMISGFRVDIGHFAFKGCTALKTVTFNSVAVIGRSAFKECTELTDVSFPEAWMIGENAFEGCTSLAEVRFQKVTKIGDESFKNCTSLRTAYFLANPARFVPLLHPINDAPAGLSCTYDSMIFYPSVFSGCTDLQTLDVRGAWNVYFARNVFEKTGNEIDIYLFDGPGDFYGHPQNENFLGEGSIAVTLRKVNLYVPATDNISFNNDESIAYFIKDAYPAIGVSINMY